MRVVSSHEALALGGVADRRSDRGDFTRGRAVLREGSRGHKIVHVLLIASQNDIHEMDAAVIDQRNRRSIRFRRGTIRR